MVGEPPVGNFFMGSRETGQKHYFGKATKSKRLPHDL